MKKYNTLRSVILSLGSFFILIFLGGCERYVHHIRTLYAQADPCDVESCVCVKGDFFDYGATVAHVDIVVWDTDLDQNVPLGAWTGRNELRVREDSSQQEGTLDCLIAWEGYDNEHVLITDKINPKTYAWSLHLVADGEEIAAESVREIVTITPDLARLFGARYTRFKKIYRARFASSLLHKQKAEQLVFCLSNGQYGINLCC